MESPRFTWFPTLNTWRLKNARKRLHEALLVLVVLAALLAWQARGTVPILLHCVLAALVGPLTGGRFLLGRVTQQPSIGADVPLLTAMACVSVVCAALQPPGYVQMGLASALLVWAIVRVALDFRGALLCLKQYVRPDEFLARLVRGG